MKPTYLAIAVAFGVGIGLLIASIFSGESDEKRKENAGEVVAKNQPSSKPVGDSPNASGDVDASKSSSTSRQSDKLSALTPGGNETADPGSSTENEFREMMMRVFKGEASEDEQLKFWEEARTGSHLAEVIAGLEKVVDEDAEEIPARMNLAQAYTVKLLGVPSGPEKGIYAAKAEKLWRDVVKLDPNHYEAQVSIATSLSHYPAFLNRTGDAISEFEKAIAIQEQPNSEIKNPDAYLELSRLQLRDSDPVNAVNTLERAAQRHPDHEEINAQLEKLKSTYVFEEGESEGSEPVE